MCGSFEPQSAFQLGHWCGGGGAICVAFGKDLSGKSGFDPGK
jgi:hypothetical protein